MSGQKKSGWYYVFVGCGVLVLTGVIAIGAVVFMTVRWTRNIKNEMEDPRLRTAGAVEAMNIETLPEGYHVEMNLEAPFGFGHLVMLTDGEPVEGTGEFAEGDHFLLYVRGPGWDADWKEFAGGGEPPFDNLGELNIETRGARRMGQGELTVGAMEVFYRTSRGEISTEGFQRDHGVFSIILVRCPAGDKRSRVIVWLGPPAAEDGGDGMRGTTGDPQRIGEMLGNFRLCG